MSDWRVRLFRDRWDLSIRLMDLRWPYTAKMAEGVAGEMRSHGLGSGRVLDLCCGNGRVSVHLAMLGHRACGVDFSEPYVVDARRKAEEHGVSALTEFRVGDVRDIARLYAGERFDAFVSAWTSIGYTTEEDDLSVFRQARSLCEPGALLFILDTMHEARATALGSESSLVDLGDHAMEVEKRYDPLTSRENTRWRFYRRRDRDLEFVDKLEYRVRVYSLSELVKLLRAAGWETEAAYGNIATKQALSTQTSLHLVASAR